MTLYQTGLIYVINNSVNDQKYFFYTITSMEEEMQRHIRNVSEYTQKSKLYLSMKEHGTDKFQIAKIEDYPSFTNYQLRSRVDEYIKKYDTINKGMNDRLLCSPNPAYKKLHEQELQEIMFLYKHYKDKPYFQRAVIEAHNRQSRIRQILYFAIKNSKKKK